MIKIKPEVAERLIESFGRRLGEAHLYFAYHAAFPLSLTPDLLYGLWTNFQRDIYNEILSIPWIAVADLLLSNLCDEVGYELYEINLVVRNVLLNRLKKDEKFGQKRINQLSDFLLDYVRSKLLSNEPDVRDFAQVQRCTALAYTRPSEAARELALLFSTLDENNTPDIVQIASLTKTFAEQLIEFQTLLIYADAMENFAYGNLNATKCKLSQLPKDGQHVQVLGVSLPIPKQFNKVLQASEQNQSLINFSIIDTITVLSYINFRLLFGVAIACVPAFTIPHFFSESSISSCSTARNEICLGERSQRVVVLQQHMRQLGLYLAPVTGYYGSATTDAVAQFQRDRGLAPTGFVDFNTWEALGLSGNPTSPSAQQRQNNNRYVVVIPIFANDTLNRVRQILPQAFAAKSGLGDYVNAGSFSERSNAEKLSNQLRDRGFDARVEFF